MKKICLICIPYVVLVLLVCGCGTKKWGITSAGENLSALTKVTDSEEDCFTPYGGDNGKDLFFSVSEGRIYSNIYKKDNPFSGSMNQKTSGKNINSSPAYCDSIDKIAFSGKLEGAGLKDIYMMNNTQGKALSQVTNTPDADEDYPCFSPNGKYIVYEKKPENLRETGCEIWLRNIETGENIMLGKGRMPSFSPDGKSIVFVKYTADASYTCLWIMGVDGDNQIQVTDAKFGKVGHPRISPDGKKIVFDCSKKRQKKDYDLYIIDKDGNNLTQLTINKSYDGQPYWTKDGNIYFTSDRGGKIGHYQIWRFKP